MTTPLRKFPSAELLASTVREVATAFRFGVVGVAATATHITAVWFLIRETALPILGANFLAFLSAFGISFAGNYFWTFRAPGQPLRAMQRFFLISAAAFAANTFLLAMLLREGWLSPFAAAVVAAALVPFIAFLAGRAWGFRGEGPRLG